MTELDDSTLHGELDHDFLGRVGERIRVLRKGQGLTVQHLAEASGVSRRLLTQIEHGQANPSLVAVTRIARQLGVDFTSLLTPTAEAACLVTAPGDHTVVWTTERGSTAHLLGVTGDARRADLWLWSLAPGDTYQGHADPAGSHELFHVLSGELTIHTEGVDHVVRAGGSATLRSDRPYAYRNDRMGPGDAATFVRTVALAP
ncbi:helix-turn-helix domain-containing protein [Phycicoccus avicenniae]|uniref:helix-turn-helix domain-containing protein n=1 Tax=Phycicoccus avicenniae TaxID=2828860 RepID=UPI003D279298